MGAKRRQRRLDGLFVADVGKDIVVDGDVALLGHRGWDPRLYHQGQEPQRLEEDGLASGVGAGDEQRLLSPLHRQIERHHVDALRQQERVSSVLDPKAVSGRAHPSVRTPRGHRITSPGVDRIEHDQCLERITQERLQRTHRITEGEENAIHLAYLVRLQLANAVACLDCGRRFHEQGRPGARRIVHDASHASPPLAAHRNHVPAVAYRDRTVGDLQMRLEARHDAFQQRDQFTLRAPQLAPHAPQRRRGIVAHASVVVDGALDVLFRLALGHQTLSQRRQHRQRHR